MRLIINADDCGRTVEVNKSIEKNILDGKITSTTIMANMDEFATAVKMYDTYKDCISFGCHLNLTEGKPLLYSQILLDIGLYKSENGRTEFDIDRHRNEFIRTEARNAVYLELCAQIERLLDSGVEISHIDSHHHIHTSPMLLMILPQILEKYNIRKIRRVRNFIPGVFARIPRNIWPYLWQRSLCKPLKFTDYFADMFDFVYREGNGINVRDKVVELMCHPSGTNPEESKLFDKLVIDKTITLVNYGAI